MTVGIGAEVRMVALLAFFKRTLHNDALVEVTARPFDLMEEKRIFVHNRITYLSFLLSYKKSRGMVSSSGESLFFDLLVSLG